MHAKIAMIMKNFNREFNLLKAIGIITMVAGHTKYDVFGKFFASYSFHMPLFLFVAGYFFKEPEIKSFVRFITKKIKTLLLPFIFYNIFYSLLAFFIFVNFKKLYGHPFNFYNYVIEPFITNSTQFTTALWFVPQLFFSLIIFYIFLYLLKKISKNRWFLFITFLLISLVPAMQHHHGESLKGIELLINRTLFSLIFVYVGYIYKEHLESKLKFNINELYICLIVQAFAWILNNHDTGFTMKVMKLHNAYIPFITSLTGIYLSLFIVKLLLPIVQENSFLEQIGKNTYHIMANHLFIFHIITIILFSINGKISNVPSNLYSVYKLELYKYIYIIIALYLSTYIGITAKKLSKCMSRPVE